MRLAGALALMAAVAVATGSPAQSQRQFRGSQPGAARRVGPRPQPAAHPGPQPTDFVVTEAGVVRPIQVFEAVDVATKFASPAAWLRDVPADVESNDVGDRRLVVLVLDDSMQGGAGKPGVAKIGHEVIAQLGPTDLAAVVYTVDGSNAQDFTTDRARLHAAVDRYNVAYGFGPLVTLKNVVDHLAGVPERRKVIFYVSAGQDLDLSILAPSASVHEGNVRGEMSRLFGQLRDVFRAAQRANVNVYTIDPIGLRAPNGTDLDPGRNQREFLQVLAEETGGRAVVLDNEPQQRVPELFGENGSYYLIGFPPTEPLDGHYRHVRVRVNRDDVEVRTRTGYYAHSSLVDGSRVEVDGSGSGLAAALPDGSLPMTLISAPFAPAGRGDASVVFALAFEAPIPDRDATETVEAEIGAFDDRGRRQGLARPRAQLALRSGRSDVVRYQLLSHMTLKPGRYHLRVAARARERELAGTLFGEVVVPDFAREPLSLSGVVLQPTPPPVSAPPDGVAGIVPLVPSTGRTFTRSDRVEAFLQVVQGGNKPLQVVVLTTRVLDGSGTVVVETRDSLDDARFSSARRVDYTFALPLAELDTGPHLLVLEAAIEGGPTVTRQVRFEVR